MTEEKRLDNLNRLFQVVPLPSKILESFHSDDIYRLTTGEERHFLGENKRLGPITVENDSSMEMGDVGKRAENNAT